MAQPLIVPLNTAVVEPRSGRVTVPWRNFFQALNGNITPIADGISQLTGDVTAGPGPGSVSATLSTTGVSAGTYGDAMHVGQFTVDAKGRLTAASNVVITDTGITQLTGDVTAGPGSGSQAATIANNAVTFAKMQDIATQRAIGRNTAGTGDPEEVTVTQILDWTA